MSKVFVGRRQVALRMGPHWFGVRSSAMRELWSERNRRGWKVRYLPFGWRAFYREGAYDLAGPNEGKL